MKASIDFAIKLNRIKSKAASEGIVIYWYNAYRPIIVQEELHKCWEDPKCREQRHIVFEPALPGESTHNYGEGIDWYCLPIWSYHRCNQLAKDEGLRIGLSFGDPYHWDNLYAYYDTVLESTAIGIENMRKNWTEAKLVEI